MRAILASAWCIIFIYIYIFLVRIFSINNIHLFFYLSSFPSKILAKLIWVFNLERSWCGFSDDVYLI